MGLAIAASPAAAAPAVDGIYDLPGVPRQLASDGTSVWVTTDDPAADVARVDASGTVTPFDLPGIAGPVGITKGPDGLMWLTTTGGVARFSPANPAGAEAFPVATITDPRRIVSGPDGALWTASNDKVVRIPTAAPATATAFTVPGMGARGIASGTDGHLWVADFGQQQAVRMATDGTFTTTALGDAPQEVAAGPNGQVAATTPTTPPHRVSLLTGTSAAVPTLVPGDPFGITYAEDGAYWTARFADSTLGRVGTDGQLTTLAGLPANSGPRQLTTGPNGTLWVGLENVKKIARVTGVTAPTTGGGGTGGTGGGGTGGTGSTPDTTAPTVTRLSLSRTVFRTGAALRAPSRRRAGIGTRLRLTLSEAATVRVVVERRTTGRRRGSSCVAPSRARRGARSCVRYVGVSALSQAGKAGQNDVAFTGRVSGRALVAARYRLRITAADAAGNRSTETVRRVRVVRR
ncbi:virginiamycin B lyase family protein [Patulibacter minatonensis]|uniref:Vgb family protein n=1 Tax=Patulibacter minatonensis TaxID=298163 RepID=UPI0004AD52F7|nr:hypothetical protein [Patulibacter minatonensis]